MILSALFLIAVALEVFLFAGKGFLPHARLCASLEGQLRKAYADLKESQKRVEAARAGLRTATDAAARRGTELRAADEAFAKAQIVTPTLVHTVGQPGAGGCFRAPVSKPLEAGAEKSQQALWGCRNFIDVWADNVDTARALVERQFAPKRGYAVGEFVAAQADEPAPPQKAAA